MFYVLHKRWISFQKIFILEGYLVDLASSICLSQRSVIVYLMARSQKTHAIGFMVISEVCNDIGTR